MTTCAFDYDILLDDSFGRQPSYANVDIDESSCLDFSDDLVDGLFDSLGNLPFNTEPALNIRVSGSPYDHFSNRSKENDLTTGTSSTSAEFTVARHLTALSSLSSKSTPTALKRWTEREEIFLTGIVLDFYYRRHSLKPSIEQSAAAKKSGNKKDKLVWREIQQVYTRACERFDYLYGTQTSSRTPRALQKHWKEMGKRQKEAFERDEYDVPLTKQRERTFAEEYNVDYILTCSETSFKNKLALSDVSLKTTELQKRRADLLETERTRWTWENKRMRR